MPFLCHCTIWSHICRFRTIAWLLELWIRCCLSELLSLQPIGNFFSRAIGTVCSRTGDVVGPTFSLFLEGCGVDSVSTLLGLWCDLHDWVFQWGILAYLYLFLLQLGMSWCRVPRLSPFLAVEIPVENGSRCLIPDRSCAWQADLLLQAFWVRGVHIVSGVHWTAEVWIWCWWSKELRSWRYPHSVGRWCQWWWYHIWIHPLIPRMPWYSLQADLS